ncbi:HNH endonuclease [Paracoccus aestuarii]|uniref:HNH endonuclease n=1 Tax=Paracoccus aestuarii TaxID=453842 RepID=A0A418ZUY5_9RHOB|nr:HNH endonuclease signature motif containing protein [Paracoccus aestuarii]RJL03428.1 HNH endonuclease [Paracoccus aestuarii]WCR00215.1 HNH endonuclease [Paracoccus aestuarii]
MHSLPVPNLTFSEIYAACVARIREPGRSALVAETEDISSYVERYVTLAETNDLFTLVPHVEVGNSTRAAHVATYEGHVANKKSDLRRYYNSIKSVKKTYRCPFCGWAQIKQVDHFVPKQIYFRLSVVPQNLVPICSDCNKAKGEYHGETKERALFHPYYDPIPTGAWLSAEISVGASVAVTYSIDRAAVDQLSGHRLDNQFRKLEIFEAYEDLASHHLVSLRDSLLAVVEDSGVVVLYSHIEGLRDQALTEAGGVQTNWKVTLYNAMLGCNEFMTSEGISLLE